MSYTITNEVRGQHFSFNIKASVPAGSVLLDVLEEAQKAEPNVFR